MADREVPLQITVLEAAAVRQHPAGMEALQHLGMAVQEPHQQLAEAALLMPAVVAVAAHQPYMPLQPEQAALVAAATVAHLLW
jgi:hypothetical protein